MANPLPSPTLDSGIILTQAAKGSAFQAGGVQFVTAPGSDKFFVTQVGKIKFKEHEYGDAQKKQAADTSFNVVDVHMVSLYHTEWFSKDQYTRSTAAQALIDSYPGAIPAAIDEYIATETAKRYWTGFTGTPAPQDGSAAAFLEAQDALTVAGYNANLSVWDNTGKRIVRSILNESTARSDAAVAVTDGVSVGDTTAYFRPLYDRPLTDGARIGQIMDSAQTKVFLRQTPGVVVIDDDTEAQDRNGIYTKIEFQIGIATIQGSVIPLTYEAPAAGE